MKRTVCAVFDIDDTLYLERDYVQSGFETVGRWASKWLHIEDFGERCWRAFASGLRRSIFNDVLVEAGREASPELVSALVAIYRTHTPHIIIAPDAAKALDKISRTASIAIISDGPAASQSRKAEALGLASFASPIILTELLGSEFCKPNPKAFEHVQRCCPADVYLYIADNPLKDFAAPKQLGWITVRVRRPHGLHYAMENPAISADREMTDFSGLPEVLAELV
jgi:putative hydrolase of the HAD superfamily